MNRSVSPHPGRTVPSSAAAASKGPRLRCKLDAVDVGTWKEPASLCQLGGHLRVDEDPLVEVEATQAHLELEGTRLEGRRFATRHELGRIGHDEDPTH